MEDASLETGVQWVSQQPLCALSHEMGAILYIIGHGEGGGQDRREGPLELAQLVKHLLQRLEEETWDPSSV